MDPFPAGGTSISIEAINNKKESISKFISALDKAILDIQKEGTKINSILPKYTSLTKDIALNSQIYVFKTLKETNTKDEILALDLMKLYTDAKILLPSSLVKGLFLNQKEINYE